jgi:hypothetical protein
MPSVKKHDTVSWKWGNGTAKGEVAQVSSKKKTITSSGTRVTRNGTTKNPAVKIKQDDGTAVLKRSSEITPQ